MRKIMSNNLDVLFVNPNAKRAVYGALASELSGIEPPIWCGLKAAYLRDKGYNVKILDAEAENLSPIDTAKRVVEENPLFVEIIVMGLNPSASSTPKMVAVRDIISKIRNKKPNVKIMLSGIHPSSLPERTLNEEDTDFLIVGEGLKTTLKLAETMKTGENNYKIKGLWYKENGEIVSNGIAEVISDLDSLPFISWDLMDMNLYRAHNWHCFQDLENRKPYAIIYTSLGCPFNCSYCNIHSMYECKPGIRFRSPKKVVDEIEYLVKNYKMKNIKILDELFVLNENRVNEICDLIIDRGLDLNIWAYARVDTVNERVLKKLKQAGVNWLCYGIEAGSKKVRDNVHKSQFGQDAIIKAMQMTHDAGIYIIGNFMFGLPEDDMETMKDTLDLAKELKCEYVNFYSVMAYPGSKLYEDSVKNGARLPKTWLGYAQLSKETTPLPSKYLASEEILAFRDQAFEDYYRNPDYLKLIEEQFGIKAVNHIKEMLSYKIERNILKT
jgi:radical SAM superfamily enzyme YgiQ (UPF0313 family)